MSVRGSHMHAEFDWERLDQFICGDGSPDERAELERWVNERPARRTLADAMRTVGAQRFAGADADSTHWDASRALRELQAKIGIGRSASVSRRA
jgi:anti-sigma factor RsiW